MTHLPEKGRKTGKRDKWGVRTNGSRLLRD